MSPQELRDHRRACCVRCGHERLKHPPGGGCCDALVVGRYSDRSDADTPCRCTGFVFPALPRFRVLESEPVQGGSPSFVVEDWLDESDPVPVDPWFDTRVEAQEFADKLNAQEAP